MSSKRAKLERKMHDTGLQIAGKRLSQDTERHVVSFLALHDLGSLLAVSRSVKQLVNGYFSLMHDLQWEVEHIRPANLNWALRAMREQLKRLRSIVLTGSANVEALDNWLAAITFSNKATL